MSSGPVAVLLLINLALFSALVFSSGKTPRSRDFVLLSVLFFFSGMPALIYQVVWQRVLFAIYGVNAESVAVVVTAFMVGLGIGNLIGGRISAKYPQRGVLIFGIAEFGIAAFGLGSLGFFHFVARYTAGANLISVILFTLSLLLVPTVLMGATLPLLVEHFVLKTKHVGISVSTLYFVNTFGSAVACYLCATLLFRELGQAGAVSSAACINVVVGATAYMYSRAQGTSPVGNSGSTENTPPVSAGLPLAYSMVVAGLSGFIALAFEMVWYRVFALASSDRAPAFALLLSTYLAGVAAGSYISEKWLERQAGTTVIQTLGVFLLAAGVISAYLPPVVAMFMARKLSFLFSAPGFFITAALVGSVLPLLCQQAVPPDQKAGRTVSYIYVSNIIGSAIGSLGVGFVIMQFAGLRSVCLGIGLLAVVLGSAILVFGQKRLQLPPIWASALVLASLGAVPLSSGLYVLLFERLVFGNRSEAKFPFAQIVENRNGVIGVTKEAAVFGGGVYDGVFNVDPMNDSNLVVRIYALSAFVPNPKHVLVIGLASGSWGQILANHPEVESLDSVEINAGYLQLIPQYPVVGSFLKNPKVHVYIDDGRRWLLAHPEARYDVIVANTTFHWRDHASGLLSIEFLQLIRAHLNPGGVYYFNSTESGETIATALRVFPHGLRVINFLAVSDSPISVDAERWLSVLRQYKIDGKIVFDPVNPAAQNALLAYAALAQTMGGPPRFLGFESSESIRARLGRQRIITDDNMGMEWSSNVQIPWRQ